MSNPYSYQPPQYPQPAYAPPGYQPPYKTGPQKPGKVQAIAIMTLIGGILALIQSLSFWFALGVSTMCIGFLYPVPIFGIVVGIMAIVKGSQLLGENGWQQPPPYLTATLQIINIINCDVWNLVLGILVLVFLGDEETKRYFRG